MPISNVRRIIVTLLVTNVITYGYALALIRTLNKQKSRNANICEMMTYMVYIIEKYDVPLTEFDAIALTEMAREHNAA